MATLLPSQQSGFRYLGRLSTPRPLDTCEMGDEDDCEERPAYWLTAPDSYVKPMMLCGTHAAEEAVYFGTPMPGVPS